MSLKCGAVGCTLHRSVKGLVQRRALLYSLKVKTCEIYCFGKIYLSTKESLHCVTEFLTDSFKLREKSSVIDLEV